jgi:O-antigen ligase
VKKGAVPFFVEGRTVMHTFSSFLSRNQALQFGIIVAVSVLIALAYGLGRTRQLAMIGAVLLFVILMWDLRLAVPLLIVVIPFGPWYTMSFGNLYLATPIAILAFAAWICRNALQPRPFTFPRNPILPALAILFIILALSAIQSLSHLLSQTSELLRFIQFFVYSCIFAMLIQMDLSRGLTRALLVLAIAVGVVEGLVGSSQWISSPGFHVTGTFGFDHSTFAAYVVFICMLLLGILFETGRWTVAFSTLMALGFMLIAVVFSFSRAGYISIVVGAVVLLLLPVSKGRKLLLIGMALAFLVVSYFMVPEDVRVRAHSIYTNLSGREIGMSYRGRLEMWKAAFRDFLDYPILGRGAWSYRLRDNFFFKVLGEAGILGFLAFLYLLYSILKQEWLAIRAGVDDRFVRGVAVGLLPGTVACLIVFNLAGDLFGVHRFMGSYWIVLALTLKYCLGETVSRVDHA